MNKEINEFETVLNEEESILDTLLQSQVDFRKAVISKDWETLNVLVNKMNTLSADFQNIDSERQVIQDELKTDEITPFFEKINTLRSKLLKFKVENEALSKYVNITRDFIQNIVENALPQSKAKVYSRTGMVSTQPQSVVLNQLF